MITVKWKVRSVTHYKNKKYLIAKTKLLQQQKCIKEKEKKLFSIRN